MTPLDDDLVERILLVGAHPDDLEFAAGGTVAGWTGKGVAVSYCLATRGQQGFPDPDAPVEQIARVREGEQREACRILGVEDLHFLDQEDGHVEPTVALRKQIVRVIRKVRPQRLVLQSPERDWAHVFASHPDHLATGEAAMQAVYPDAGNPLAFRDLRTEEGLEPWTVGEVWVMTSARADHFVDVTETFDRKMQALRAHGSQVGHVPDLEKRLRSWGERSARAVGLPEGRLAELFKVVPLR